MRNGKLNKTMMNPGEEIKLRDEIYLIKFSDFRDTVREVIKIRSVGNDVIFYGQAQDISPSVLEEENLNPITSIMPDEFCVIYEDFTGSHNVN